MLDLALTEESCLFNDDPSCWKLSASGSQTSFFPTLLAKKFA